jgi:hypothetical protein
LLLRLAWMQLLVSLQLLASVMRLTALQQLQP